MGRIVTSDTTSTRSYSGLITLDSFEDRFAYLRLGGGVGRDTFGFDRWINQKFYRSREWKSARQTVILRDSGCDLGILDRPIHAELLIHHMNPVTKDDIINRADWILDPEFLICTTHTTHNAIHFGVENLAPPVVMERSPNDTAPWRR